MKSLLPVLSACLFIWTSSFSLTSFPGAEGWGAETPGGRGPNPKTNPPKVYVVTTTAESGKGSFNEAFQATGPRIIVFRVSGVINLQSEGAIDRFRIDSNASYVTIAGQTSPGGVTLVTTAGGTGIMFAYHGHFHDFIFRFLRFRGAESNNDALTLNTTNHFMMDHCDISGGSDETLEVTASNDFTIQWTTITNSSKCSDCQTYGFLMAYPPTTHISLHHNLFAHHEHRMPAIHWDKQMPPDFGQIDYRNNVLYNGGSYFLVTAAIDPVKSVHMNIVGNTFKGGPQSPPNKDNEAAWFWSMVSLEEDVIGYEEDNLMISPAGVQNPDRVRERTPNRVNTVWSMPKITTQSRAAAFDLVLDKAGAWPRDAMNTRTVNEVRSGKGQFGKNDDAKITTGLTAPPDADMDGMPDAWETAMGLNPNSAADNVTDQDGDGYLNIEEYINDVASARLGDVLQNPKGADAVFLTALINSQSPSQSPRLRAVHDRSTGYLRVTLPEGLPIEGKIEVVDAHGRVLKSLPAQKVTEWKYGSASKLPSGVYMTLWVVNGVPKMNSRLDVQ